MKRDRSDRIQINIVLDSTLRDAIEEIRAASRPVLSLSDAVRQAIMNERNAVRRRGASSD